MLRAFVQIGLALLVIQTSIAGAAESEAASQPAGAGLSGSWELTILDAAPPATELASLKVADLDGDGNQEIVMGGMGSLIWNRPATLEKGVIVEGNFAVGLAIEDVDGDGKLDIVAAAEKPKKILWFKSQGGIEGPWQTFEIDPKPTGGIHDLVFVDIDQDGENELVAAEPYGKEKCVYVYKRNADPTQPWSRYLVNKGRGLEGTSLADVDGDEKLEILCGTELFHMPDGGPYAGAWSPTIIAPKFRVMCRTELIDISGDGKADAILSESEYQDGKISWFENGQGSWIEHPIDSGNIFAHSLKSWRDEATGAIHIFLAEMAQGGWNAPYNYDARLIEYVSADQGKAWQKNVLYKGAGTHEATVFDIDNDGELEIVGKVWGKENVIPQVQMWKRVASPSPVTNLKHSFIDETKSSRSSDILSASVRSKDQRDVFCGSMHYQFENAKWNKAEIPGIAQVINAYDIDGDGIDELIATKKSSSTRPAKALLTSELCWLKWVDGQWKEYSIGTGSGDWPHGSVVAPVLPDGKLALMLSYHSANMDKPDYPEIFEIPADPTAGPWTKRVLAEIQYGEEMKPGDFNGDGLLDLAAGKWWLENAGDGTFKPHQIVEDLYPARLAVHDFNGDGRPDIVLGEEVLNFKEKKAGFARLAWLENPGATDKPWAMHVIDKIRCPHSIDVGDLDGDGEMEIVAGEHDPFHPELQSRCRLFVYKKADLKGMTWKRFMLDDRFEHHCGAQVVELEPGKPAILSHGWVDSKYVTLWQ